jgi:putative ABC transport system permease protein
VNTIRVILSLAWRESRASRRRLLLFGSAVSIGVAALVAISSFTTNLQEAVRTEARELLGADVALRSSRPFTEAVEALLDSAQRAGVAVARRTTFSSMGYVRRTEGIRLLDVRAVGPGFPFYGEVITSPPGRWRALDTGRVALVDTSLLVALDARIGDTLELGRRQFVIAGAVSEVPGHVTGGGLNAFGAQVYIPVKDVEGTGLIVFGSRARYHALLRTDSEREARRFVARNAQLLRQQRVSSETAQEAQDELNEVLHDLSNFLQFVGLVALLLGGIGVASGVGAFVRGKLDTVAVLRCLAATRPQVFAIYLTQAAVLGLVSAGLGAGLGVAVQLMLPRLLSGLLPVDVRVAAEPRAVLAGIGIGLAVSLLFALRPLLEVRLVSPLQALRRAFEERPRTERDPLRLVSLGALAVLVLVLCMARDGDPAVGLGYAGAIAGSVVVLTLASSLAVRLARSSAAAPALARRWPYVVRQGVANLHRPRNQTRTVVTALGFGVALLATLYLVQANLLSQIDRAMANAVGKPNVVFLDIQPDQKEGVRSEVRDAGHPVIQEVPLVPMRIAAINGRDLAALTRDTSANRPSFWALRHEYRSTWRDTLTASERLVRGAWWTGTGRPDSTGAYPLSLSLDVATDLKVDLGDAITWNVQGAMIPTRVAAVREVDWARFEPNFFAVLSSAALEKAPHSSVLLTRVEDAARRARLQRRIAERWPNVTSVDVALVQRTVQRLMGRVALAVRFMAAFSLATGALVLLGAVAAGRLERIREGALLKALGATQRQLRRIFLVEYLSLGVLAGMVGIGLATAGAWAFTKWVFELSFTAPLLPLGAVLASTGALVALIGLAASREVFSRTAMEVLRDV